MHIFRTPLKGCFWHKITTLFSRTFREYLVSKTSSLWKKRECKIIWSLHSSNHTSPSVYFFKFSVHTKICWHKIPIACAPHALVGRVDVFYPCLAACYININMSIVMGIFFRYYFHFLHAHGVSFSSWVHLISI